MAVPFSIFAACSVVVLATIWMVQSRATVDFSNVRLMEDKSAVATLDWPSLGIIHRGTDWALPL